MASNMRLTLLADLKPFKTRWKVQVKVLHTWKQYQTKSGESLKIILADEMGTKIHITVKKNLLHRFERLMVVGEWKFIENFSLNQVSGQYRATKHQFKMSFISSTVVTKSANRSDSRFFEFLDYDTILNDSKNVIGRVESVRELETIPVMNKDTSKCEFDLCNVNLPVNGGNITFLSSKPHQRISYNDESNFDQFPMVTIAELQDYLEVGKCKNMCTVYAVDTDWSWFYLVCTKCGKKVYKIPKREDEKFCDKTKKLYSCETCDAKVSSVSARYKLHLCVMDNTSKIKCFLFDSNAKNIVNQSADEILKRTYDEIQDLDVVPDALQNLVGKTYQFLICVEKENLYGGSNTYKVGKVWKDNQASLMNTHSQESSDDVSSNIKTPLSKRERDDPKDSVDSSSSSKKSCNSGNSVETIYANEVIDEDTLKSDDVLVNAFLTSESNEGVAKGQTR
ncbi:uncharacterized protein LOC112089132 [Eutrema salsugineum]|uniref:uncharacterized protein LOC112089132 n=1 Tax=Eutrema salsugineum TaxID=72664 RepID=UPI000CED15A5|nr:uncharacterized protein LOC112089132 [Eutrema salsugineum]